MGYGTVGDCELLTRPVISTAFVSCSPDGVYFCTCHDYGGAIIFALVFVLVILPCSFYTFYRRRRLARLRALNTQAQVNAAANYAPPVQGQTYPPPPPPSNYQYSAYDQQQPQQGQYATSQQYSTAQPYQYNPPPPPQSPPQYASPKTAV
ncbi:hypothetical protein DM01DRAFT_1371723 [Hesseltinella vesiculosa]|uniref:Uncharacterized protein n=1 Tax=Hesseltinella vesiculosa TaxID=101127 RepID=A0A1X2GPQ0_9FUNG|nr:hypothetical protein DM01DRAFT_1371723 [Hesseltinella vesiculosa]